MFCKWKNTALFNLPAKVVLRRLQITKHNTVSPATISILGAIFTSDFFAKRLEINEQRV